MNVSLKSLWIVAIPAFVATSAAQEGEQVQSARIERSDLSVTFRDNSQSPRMLSGIDSLFNTKHAADYDASGPND